MKGFPKVGQDLQNILFQGIWCENKSRAFSADCIHHMVSHVTKAGLGRQANKFVEILLEAFGWSPTGTRHGTCAPPFSPFFLSNCPRTKSQLRVCIAYPLSISYQLKRYGYIYIYIIESIVPCALSHFAGEPFFSLDYSMSLCTFLRHA